MSYEEDYPEQNLDLDYLDNNEYDNNEEESDFLEKAEKPYHYEDFDIMVEKCKNLKNFCQTNCLPICEYLDVNNLMDFFENS